MIKYELRVSNEMSAPDIKEYFDEFNDSGENCYVLYRLYEVDVDQQLKEATTDTHTHHVGLYVNDRLAGIGRVTPHPNHMENGMIGYAIRPSLRGKRYASMFIRLIEDFCKHLKMDRITACVDASNFRSLMAFNREGWKATGIYRWPGDRLAIEISPKAQHTTYIPISD